MNRKRKNKAIIGGGSIIRPDSGTGAKKKNCRCPECGYVVLASSGVACSSRKCPECKVSLINA